VKEVHSWSHPPTPTGHSVLRTVKQAFRSDTTTTSRKKPQCVAPSHREPSKKCLGQSWRVWEKKVSTLPC